MGHLYSQGFESPKARQTSAGRSPAKERLIASSVTGFYPSSSYSDAVVGGPVRFVSTVSSEKWSDVLPAGSR
jgi:hypothetical protein